MTAAASKREAVFARWYSSSGATVLPFPRLAREDSARRPGCGGERLQQVGQLAGGRARTSTSKECTMNASPTSSARASPKTLCTDGLSHAWRRRRSRVDHRERATRSAVARLTPQRRPPALGGDLHTPPPSAGRAEGEAAPRPETVHNVAPPRGAEGSRGPSRNSGTRPRARPRRGPQGPSFPRRSASLRERRRRIGHATYSTQTMDKRKCGCRGLSSVMVPRVVVIGPERRARLAVISRRRVWR